MFGVGWPTARLTMVVILGAGCTTDISSSLNQRGAVLVGPAILIPTVTLTNGTWPSSCGGR